MGPNMSTSIFDIESEAYHQPNSTGLFKLTTTVLIYCGICDSKITLPIKDARLTLTRRLTINGINYAIIFIEFRNNAKKHNLYSIDSFRIGGYTPYILKENYSFPIANDDEFDDEVITRYIDHLVARIQYRTNTFNDINCAIVHGRDIESLISFIKSQLVRGRNTLFAEQESDLLTFNPIIHSNVIINFSCDHLSKVAIELLTAPSNRRYMIEDRIVIFLDCVKLVFLTCNDGGVIFDRHLDYVGQKFRVVELTRSNLKHESLSIRI